jgi:NTE family protein
MKKNKNISKKINLTKSIDEQIEKELAIILNKTENTITKSILVLSGGGIKGISHIGAIKALDELGILKNIKIIAGSSVGALVGCLVNIGYKPNELYNFITLFDFTKMKSFKPDNILVNYGLDDGKNTMLVLTKLFIARKIDPDISFYKLYKKTGKTLIVTSSCINDKKIYYFSHEKYPDMKVLQAIRMSISIPIYFAPVMYENKMFIDGGCIDNFPIQIFKDNLDAVIGIYVTSLRDNIDNINNIEIFLLNMIQCLFEGVTCNSLKGFEKQSIKIQLDNKDSMQLSLSTDKKEELFIKGYNTVLEYFNNKKN